MCIGKTLSLSLSLSIDVDTVDADACHAYDNNYRAWLFFLPMNTITESCIDFRAATHVRENFHQQRMRLSAIDDVRRFDAIRESSHTAIHLMCVMSQSTRHTHTHTHTHMYTCTSVSLIVSVYMDVQYTSRQGLCKEKRGERVQARSAPLESCRRVQFCLR